VKKSITLLLVLVFLAASCTVVAKPVKAQYQGDISIGADGSVSPSTAPIERFGASYILTSNVTGKIAVKTNNIIFDGNGHAISGGDYYGIEVSSVSNVTITNTTITGSACGIAVLNASSNIISGNSFVDNIFGISLSSYWENGKCSRNVIVGNNFTGCSRGFWIYDSSSNTICHNNFIKNANILDDAGYLIHLGSINIWDDGQGLGNYWSDYLTRYPNATEIDNSGIGDIPYFVRPTDYLEHFVSIEAREFWTKLNAAYAANTDRYPLMEPFTTTPPKISVLSPLNQRYNETSIPLVFTLDKLVNWTGYSLDGESNVTVTSSSLNSSARVVMIANVTKGVHKVTVYANDTYGNMGASETVTFTVAKPEPFPTTLVVASVITVAVVGVSIVVYFKKRKH
jgi:parallel beta-helix repeat protein